MLLLVAIVAAALLGAPAYLRLFRREMTRADAMQRSAQALGFTYWRADPAYPGTTAQRYPFELLSRGTRQECENVFRGSVEGVDLVGFDLSYIDEAAIAQAARAPGEQPDAVPQRVTCVLADLGGSFPHLLISPVGIIGTAIDTATWAAWGVRNQPIQFESGSFDRAFQVRSDDRRFASALVDPAMMAWLLANGWRWQWELQGAYVLCNGGLVPPSEVGEMVCAIVAFSRHVPRVVTSLYPT